MANFADMIRSACVWEATAPKPGNVYPSASFPDLSFEDFVRSADAVAPILAKTSELGVGRAIFESIQATRTVVSSNTNLGIVLLLAPLAAVPMSQSLKQGIEAVLSELTREDAQWVYRAIRLAHPGGLGTSESEDVATEPTGTLREVMMLAANRDGVAAQYANGFAWVLNEGLPFLQTIAEHDEVPPLDAIVDLQMRLLATHSDTLIARKCGITIAEEASRRAAEICAVGGTTHLGRRMLSEFDEWLRADGHRRNPGTTADLVAACLFAWLRERSREL